METLADFPTAVAGVITLAAGTMYLIAKAVDVGANRFVLADNSLIQGQHAAISSIVSTTTGDLFTGVGVPMRIEDITIDASSAALLFNHDGSSTKQFKLESVASKTHTGAVATIANALTISVTDVDFVGGTHPFVISGASTGPATFNTFRISGFTGTGIDLGTAVIQGLGLEAGLISGTGASDIGLKGLTASGNIATGTKGTVSRVSFNGTTAPLSGIDSLDLQYEFTDNTGVTDTRQEAQAFVHGNAIVTAITTINTPVKVDAGTAFTAAHEEQFTVSTDGRITYNGIDDVSLSIVCTISGTCVSSTHSYTFATAKNGSIVAATQSSREFASTAVGSLSVAGLMHMSTGDYLEIWVENTTGTVDFTVEDMNFLTKV